MVNYFYDTWGASADGSMDCYATEGYAISGEGNYRLSKADEHFAFMAFNGLSDGPDGIWPDRGCWKGNDSGDGVLLKDWLVDKKAFRAWLYVRDAIYQLCDPTSKQGTYLNAPVAIMGFRCGNTGTFVDRGKDANGDPLTAGHPGCCAAYYNSLLDGGENTPAAWRTGKPYVDRDNGVLGHSLGYSQIGDINTSDPQFEYYKVSGVDTLYPSQQVKVGTASFGTTGYQGFSTNAPGMAGGHFAFEWLVAKSDAHLLNSGQMTEADCTGQWGEIDPRNMSGDASPDPDWNFASGWYAKHIDRAIIQGMGSGAADPEVKGLVFNSINAGGASHLYHNDMVFSRDQGRGEYSPYLAILATYAGDCDNDGSVDVIDLLTMADTWGLVKGDPGFNPECDLNCDDSVDVVDLLTLAWDFGQSLIE